MFKDASVMDHTVEYSIKRANQLIMKQDKTSKSILLDNFDQKTRESKTKLAGPSSKTKDAEHTEEI